MIEVFKTNVKDRNQANMLIGQIHKNFCGYTANFDLDDCDKILRIACDTGHIQASFLIHLLKDFGYTAEVLPDDLQSLPIIQK
jgi:hypothetical protein